METSAGQPPPPEASVLDLGTIMMGKPAVGTQFERLVWTMASGCCLRDEGHKCGKVRRAEGSTGSPPLWAKPFCRGLGEAPSHCWLEELLRNLFLPVGAAAL